MPSVSIHKRHAKLNEGKGVTSTQVVEAFVDHAGHQLCNAEWEGNKPKTKADWEHLAEHATQLAVLRNKSFRPLATVNSMMSRRCVTKVNDRVVGSARLGGLHHHYELEPIAAIAFLRSTAVDVDDDHDYATLKRGNKRSALPRSIICSNARGSFRPGS